tara:strand:+ start:315 stop:500 length:186 start_codon:yes stop_codon:yes gene_type:complete
MDLIGDGSIKFQGTDQYILLRYLSHTTRHGVGCNGILLYGQKNLRKEDLKRLELKEILPVK